MDKITISPIAHIKTDFKEKFGIPRQSGRAHSISQIVFTPEYRNPDALREIEGFSHLWLIFDFSLSHLKKWSPTVRPPRLGGNKKVGVFASRSPFRPNPIGLSSVKLIKVQETLELGKVLIVEGADLLDGTPIFDIKPYIPSSDCHADAVGGYADNFTDHSLRVIFPENLKNIIPTQKLNTLIECLADDPRPSYQDDDRIYSMRFDKFDVHFTVNNEILTVKSIDVL